MAIPPLRTFCPAYRSIFWYGSEPSGASIQNRFAQLPQFAEKGAHLRGAQPAPFGQIALYLFVGEIGRTRARHYQQLTIGFFFW
jgi:hypothetical protein